MATIFGLLRARGRARGAQVLQRQQQLCGSVSTSSTDTSVRLLARLSYSSHAAVGSTISGSSCSASASAARSSSASARRQQRLHSSPFTARSNSRALFSSKARPAQAGARERTVDRRNPVRMTFDGGNNEDRLARLDDGDKYPDFVDLRLAEADKLFPEGLAGGGQGALERATTGGTSTAVLHREAADALIHSLDDFAASEGSDGAPFGIEGTRSEKWRKNCEARHYGNPAPAATGEEDADSEEGMGGPEAAADGSGGGEEDDIVGDVRAAAAEGAAAAAAAAEAVTAAAMAAAGGGPDNATANGDEADSKEEEAAGDKDGKKILGTGPIWEEMKALAESRRKPLRGVRRVYVQPGQRSYLLTGRRGSGKSCVLNQAVLHARSTGWIVLFVPDGRNLVQKGIYCQPSPVFEGLYDLPVQSLKRLKTLRDAHGDQLKEISIKDPEVLARHEGAETLLDVMDKGLADEELAGTAHYDVMRELLATTEAKVMLAIDEYNELFQMSHWHYGDDKLEAPHLTATLPLVPPLVSTGAGLAFADDELASVANPKAAAAAGAAGSALVDARAGAACLPPPPANGIVVCAVSGRYPPVKKLKKKKKWTPFEEMAGRLATAVSIPVEPYTRREFLRVVKRYARVEQVVHEPLGPMEVAKVHAKSDGLAEHVFETCRFGRYRTVVHDD